SVDTARVDKIVLSAIGACLCFTLARSVGNDVALRTWLVLQLDGVVVETGFLIIELDVAILVKLHRRRIWSSNRCAARSRPRAGRIQTTKLNSCRYRLTTKSIGVNRDGGGPLAARDSAGRD